MHGVTFDVGERRVINDLCDSRFGDVDADMRGDSLDRQMRMFKQIVEVDEMDVRQEARHPPSGGMSEVAPKGITLGLPLKPSTCYPISPKHSDVTRALGQGIDT